MLLNKREAVNALPVIDIAKKGGNDK